ncbi:MAG: hypothetical protein WD874_00895 [Parcubacteria group bacterium]
MKSVGHIFGGEAKVKIMRLFVFNPNQVFSLEEIAIRVKEKPRTVKKEVGILMKAGLVCRKGRVRFVVKRKRGKPKVMQVRGFTLDPEYSYIEPLSNFLIDARPLTEKDIAKRISRAGNMKLIILSGFFLHDPDSRVDLLVVGDRIKKANLVSTISNIEAKIGKEIRYASFETPDFNYRLGAYDKLVRDILDYPHKTVLNKLGI